MRKRTALMMGALLIVAVTTSGCFLQLLVGAVFVDSLSEQLDIYFAALEANATTATCRPNETGPGVLCRYTFASDDGFTEQTSTAELISELGFFGVLVDPMVLELPAGVTDIAGTYEDANDPNNQGALLVYPGLAHVPVDDTRTLTPGPGKQLVIVDLPPGAPVDNVDYRFRLSYQEIGPAGQGPSPFKAILTGRVEARNGKTFYPPLLPCTSNLDEVPELLLPTSATPEALDLPLGVAGCDREFYTYFFNEAPQSMACDLDNDTDVDRDDLRQILAFRNRPTSPGDPRDINGDDAVNVRDARVCVFQCTFPRCAVR